MNMRHLGLTSRLASGAQPQAGSLHARNKTPRVPDSHPLLLLLPNPDFSHTRRDIFLMIRVALLVFLTGLGITAAFILFLLFGAN
jgi:hypothetical protein